MNIVYSHIHSLSNRRLPQISVGDTVRVHQKIQEGKKTRIQVFEGLVIAKRHGKEPGASIVVRKITGGIGVERTFPLYLPTIEKIEVTKKSKVRRSKLYFLRDKTARQTRKKLKTKEILIPGQESLIEEPKESESQPTTTEPEKKKEKVEAKSQDSKEVTKQEPQKEAPKK